MNVTDLTTVLIARLQTVFAEFGLNHDVPNQPQTEFKHVTIYDGHPPKTRRGPNREEVAPALPAVVVRPREGEDAEGDGNARMSWCEVHMVVIAQRVADEGYRDALAMIQKIRTDLLASPYIDSRYRVELPIKWELEEDDVYPQWYGRVIARINLPQAVELFPLENEVHYGETKIK